MDAREDNSGKTAGYLFWKDKGEIRYYLLALLGFFCLSPAIGELLLYCLDIIRQFLK